MIDVVGYFGSMLSYATVASEVARALRAAELLGMVSNLDAEWHPRMEDLRPTEIRERGSHTIVFAPPNHYVDGYAAIYGRTRSALFACPNTDRLAKEHAETCVKFGQIFVPSAWCEDVVQRYAVTSCAVREQPETTILPLGVSPAFCADEEVLLHRESGLTAGMQQALHLSTDRAWPGRKGTSELLDAWRILVERNPRLTWRLVLSVPPPLLLPATLTVADLLLSERVDVVGTPDRGISDTDLETMYSDSDMIIAPSRCEGFGMMILAAIINRCPLVTTYNTGHVDFLSEVDEGWLGVPTPHMEALYGEEGLAPVVEPRVLANTIEVAMNVNVRRRMIGALASSGQPSDWGTWPWATELWVERIQQWIEETA